jgi:hypothetical protein
MDVQETWSVSRKVASYIGLLEHISFCEDFLETQSKQEKDTRVIPLSALWHVLIEGLNPIWPSRIKLAGKSLGDVWPCTALKKSLATEEEGEDLVPFHKLTQWITYSLVEALEKVAKWKVEGLQDLTGLPEYRNGLQYSNQAFQPFTDAAIRRTACGSRRANSEARRSSH